MEIAYFIRLKITKKKHGNNQIYILTENEA